MGLLFLVGFCFVGQYNTEPSGQVEPFKGCLTLREQIKNGWIRKEGPSKDERVEEKKIEEMQQELLLVLLETLDFIKITPESCISLGNAIEKAHSILLYS